MNVINHCRISTVTLIPKEIINILNYITLQYNIAGIAKYHGSLL